MTEVALNPEKNLLHHFLMSDKSLCAISLALVWCKILPNFNPQNKWKHI